MDSIHLLMLLHNFVIGKSIMTVYRSSHQTHNSPYVLIIVAIWQPFRLEDVNQFPRPPCPTCRIPCKVGMGDVPLLYSLLLESWVRGFQDDWYWKPVLKPATRTVRTVVPGWATNSGRCYHRVAIPTKRSAIDGAHFGANAL